MSRRPSLRASDAPGEGTSGRARRELRGIHWGVAGFLAGTVFWHLVGFWDFVGRIVFRDSGRKVVEVSEVQAPPTARSQKPRTAKLEGTLEGAEPIVTGSIAGAVSCIELRRDADGATSAGACSGEARPLKPGNFLRRGDRASAEAWAVAVPVSAAVGPAPAAPWSTTVIAEPAEAKVAGRN